MPTASALRTPPPQPRRGSGEVVPLRQGNGEGPGWTPAYLAKLGMWIALAPIAMLFFALASAYIVRRGMGSGWLAVELPGLVWVNTAVLLASSLTLELGRRALRRHEADGGWVWGTFLLGLAFLVGQVAAWVQLTAAGIGISATAYGSFFYVLSGAHGLHILGGVAALLAAALWPREQGWLRVPRADALHVTAIYWHFLDLLWLGILLLLVLGR